MLVSVVITNFNYGAYVAEAIESAISQTYGDLEVIVVDDCSTDNSREVISRYAERVTIVLREHGGQLASLNEGFARSRGDIVIFLDADDVLYPDAVKRHVEKLQKPGIVKSQGYLKIVDRSGVPTGGRIPVRISPPGNYRQRFFEYGPRSHRCSFTSGNAWARSFLRQVMPLPETRGRMNGPDGYLGAIDPLFGSMEVVDGPVAQYRVHGLNMGPVNYRFDEAYLKDRLLGYEARVAYAAAGARALGYQVDTKKWFERAGWKMNLVSHVLHLLGDEARCIPFGQLVLSPLRQMDAKLPKALARSLLLALVGAAPRPVALRLARQYLDQSWGKRATRV